MFEKEVEIMRLIQKYVKKYSHTQVQIADIFQSIDVSNRGILSKK